MDVVLFDEKKNMYITMILSLLFFFPSSREILYINFVCVCVCVLLVGMKCNRFVVS